MSRALSLVVTVAVTLALAINGTPAQAAPGHTVIASATPSAASPAINDGQVNAITQVGSTVVVGGTFSSVTPPGGGAQGRTAVVAFDAATGALRSGFNPVLNGTVQDVMPGPVADTVYVAGSFTTVSGTTQSHVTLLNVNTGAIVGNFRPASTNGVVNAVTMAQGRLVLGGNFTVAGGASHGGLASINPTTGAIDSFISVNVNDRHNDTGSGAQGPVGVRDLEATSTGDKVAVIGNFKHVNGLDRDQLVVLDLTPSTSSVDADWHTRRYEPYCFNFAFDTYVRGVSVSPDDSYFVVTATGGQNGGTLCDTAARFEFSATGDDIQPTWVDYTGGDTLWSVEVTEDAVYVGGHQRWMNNSDASDSNGQGSVPRAGLAALDPDSGLPFAWNPGRNPRGAAAFALFASTTGLWVGSDTEWIGNFRYKRPRLAYFPLAGGAAPASETTPGLPANVYLGAPRTVSQGNVLYRVNAGGTDLEPLDGGPGWTGDGDVSSPYRNDGSNSAGWGSGASIDASVPSTTPAAIFDSERWSPSDNPRMSWDFPAPAGLPLQVRLFFANRCSCTASSGARAFDVDIDGTRVLDDFDIVAAVGDQRGTMRAFDITSDGSVNIDFAHVTENPLINGIEIVRRDLAPPTGGGNVLNTIHFNGNTAAAPTSTDNRGIDWTQVRGAFVAGDTLFYGQSDGYLYKRRFTATATGAATQIDPYNDPAWSDVATGSGNTYRGRVPDFYGELSSLTGEFYAGDRIYYTRSGDSSLYWRWFNVDSGIVGSQRFTANGTRNWSDTGGMFRDGNTLYVVNRNNGNLASMPFVDGSPQGSLSVVDATNDWRARALFIGPGGGNQVPVASFTATCTNLTCQVDGSASSDPDGSIASYAWTFGDGQSGNGQTTSNTYAAAGAYTITLSVTDNGGATSSTTRNVSVTQSPPTGTDISYVASATADANSTNPTVSVPGAVKAGDLMVLVGSYGVSGSAPTTPTGWALADARQGSGIESYVWTRRATASDAGGTVQTALPSIAKSALVLSAYRGVSATQAISAIASSTDSSTTQHTSPTAPAPAGGWVLQVWTDKSSGTTSWTPPSGQAVRASVYGSGTGRMTALATDSGGPVSAGPAGGLTAVTDATSGRGIAWTITLARSS